MLRSGGMKGIYLVQHADGTVARDSPDMVGVTLTLSAGHRVRYRSGRVSSDTCPAVGSVTIHAPGERARLSLSGRCRALRLELPIADMASFLEEEVEADGSRLDLRGALYADDPRLLRLLVDAMVGDDGDAAYAVAAHLAAAYGGRRRPTKTAGGIAPRRLGRIKDFVEQAPLEHLDLRRLAAEIGMSPFHFSREFKKTVGEAPMHYVGRRLALRSLALLAEGDASTAEVARRTGFAHASHLARHLRSAIGMTPSQYRALVRA